MKNPNTDRVMSISAIIVSIGTLLMIFYQTSLTRKEQKASVLPSLFIGYSFNESDSAVKETIWLTNQGLGPAFIEQVSVLAQGNVYDTDPFGYISETQAKHETTFINRLSPGRIIPANEGMTIYEKNTDSNSTIVLSNIFEFSYEISQMPTDQADKAVIEIIYKNVYGDRWKIKSNQTTPVAVK